MDNQTSSLRKELSSIRQELHSTVSALQTTSTQNTKRIDDLEAAATEWSSSVMGLETTVTKLQTEVCSLKSNCLDLEGRSRRLNIILVGVDEGQEKNNARQFCATVLKDVPSLSEEPRLDRSQRLGQGFPMFFVSGHPINIFLIQGTPTL